MDCYFYPYIPTEAKTPSADEINKLQCGAKPKPIFHLFVFFLLQPMQSLATNARSHLVPLYFFTLVWSVGLGLQTLALEVPSFATLDVQGATCDNKGRQIVNDT